MTVWWQVTSNIFSVEIFSVLNIREAEEKLVAITDMVVVVIFNDYTDNPDKYNFMGPKKNICLAHRSVKWCGMCWEN